MPSKKKKYNARFPAGRIKKIMQSDEEVGKVAQAVPVIISRTLELFVESLLNKTMRITNARNAKTLSTSHMKQCIMSESRFDFLRELVKNVPDINVAEEQAAAALDNLPNDLNILPPHIAAQITVSIGSTSCSSSSAAKASTITSTTISPLPTQQLLSTPTPPPPPSPNGNFGNIGSLAQYNSASNNHRSNGNKRNLIPYTQSHQHSVSHHPTDEINLTTLPMPQAPGFYKDHYTETDIADQSSVIQYTPKLHTQKSTSTLDIRPPKLKRVDSAPAGSNLYIKHNSASSSSAAATTTTTAAAAAAPIKINLSATAALTNECSQSKASKTVPPLAPIKTVPSLTGTPTTNIQSPFYHISNTRSQSASSAGGNFVYPSTSKDIVAGGNQSPIIKINVSNDVTPVVKIDYSNLNLTLPKAHSTNFYPLIPAGSSYPNTSSAFTSATPSTTSSPLPSSSSSSSASSSSSSSLAASASATSKSTVMINMDLLNNCNKNAPTYKPIATTNTLEMDEDYDNI